MDTRLRVLIEEWRIKAPTEMSPATGEELIYLWNIQREDLPLLLAWRNDREIMRYLPSAEKLLTWEGHQTWFCQLESNGFYRMLWYGGIANEPDRGYPVQRIRPIGIGHVKRDKEVGIIIGEKGLWRQGIGTRALSSFLKLYENEVGKSDLWAVIHPRNHASRKLFERCGFKHHKGERSRSGQWVYRRGINA